MSDRAAQALIWMRLHGPKVLWLWLLLLLLISAYRLGFQATPHFPSRLVFEQVAASVPSSSPLHQPPPAAQLLPNPAPAAHSSSLVVLGNGDLLVVWFAGSREGARDVVISSARFQAGRWSAPATVMTRQQVAASQWEYTKKVGNPVIFKDHSGRLHLIFVSVNFGGWAGSRLNHSVSLDEGQTWSAPIRLVLSPFFNLSTLVRTPPVVAQNGFALPVYHELIHKIPEILWFDAGGQFQQQSRLHTASDLTFSRLPNTLQPALLRSADGRWQAWLRDTSSAHKVAYSESPNGVDWSAITGLALPNKDSALAVAHLSNQIQVMAFNDGLSGTGRQRLSLATSTDGQHWDTRYRVEDQAEGEFSYPALLVHDGVLDLTYTHQRQAIKHLRVGAAWLLAQPVIKETAP